MQNTCKKIITWYICDILREFLRSECLNNEL